MTLKINHIPKKLEKIFSSNEIDFENFKKIFLDFYDNDENVKYENVNMKISDFKKLLKKEIS